MTSKQCQSILDALAKARVAFGPDTEEIDLDRERAFLRLVKLGSTIVRLKLKAEKRESKAKSKR
jgi:hypothetical protein